MATVKALDGKPHVRFYDGNVSSAAMSRHGALPCRMKLFGLCVCGLMFTAFADVTTNTVSTVAELEEAIWGIGTEGGMKKDDVIIIRAGTYDLSECTHKGAPGSLRAWVGCTIQGETDDPKDTVLKGAGDRILWLRNNGGYKISNITFDSGDSSGYAYVKNEEIGRGGAIMAEGRSVMVENCVFIKNKAGEYGGGAVGIKSESDNGEGPSFYGCKFLTNSVTASSGNLQRGGAINTATTVSGCTFIGNYVSGSSSTGGAICNASNIVDSVFIDNYTTAKGGGAIYQPKNDSMPSMRVTGCTFIGNRSTDRGSAIKGVVSLGNGYLVSNCTFIANKPYENATTYGAVAVCSNVVDCVFRDNVGGQGGAASESRLIGCRIENNLATLRGGAAFKSTLINCTNVANRVENNNTDYASELGGACIAEGCLFEYSGVPLRPAFEGGAYSRCRFVCPTNGYLFTGAAAITNCLIAFATNCTLFRKTAAGAGLYSCSLVSNVFTGVKTSDACTLITAENTLFYGNKLKDGERDYDIDANFPRVIGTFNNCIYASPDESYIASGTGNYNYYSERATFNMRFAGAANPGDPFAITLKSPAHSKAGIVSDWMASATDIRGEGYPRLRDGKVDIGCYQCWDWPRGLVITVK